MISPGTAASIAACTEGKSFGTLIKCEGVRFNPNSRMPNKTRDPMMATRATRRNIPAKLSSAVFLRIILHLRNFHQQAPCVVGWFQGKEHLACRGSCMKGQKVL